MGSIDESYSVPKATQKIFTNEILNNPLLPTLPKEIHEAGKLVHFTGNNTPSIPINWRFAESAAALKAFEASLLNVLRIRKYKDECKLSEVTIDTDHASLFIMSPFMAQVIGGKDSIANLWDPSAVEKIGIKNTDLHRAGATPQRALATNIYKTKDGRYYHVHGSMNPEPTLTALGMDLEGEEGDDREKVVKRFEEVVGKWEAGDLDRRMNEEFRQAGTVCWSTEEFKRSEHGRANAHVGLYELERDESSKQPAAWWPENSSVPSSPSRPLAGLKVVDLTRIIAAPTITRCLAEMGASVMRVTSPQVTDMSTLHQDLNWGKWTPHLHLKNESDRLKLLELIKEADVVVEGYRPEVMKKYGLSREEIFDLVKNRDRGIIHVKENCYGWHGPWQHRSGWQQISDACCGVSLAYGKAMGHDAAVTPIFPNSDYCTGITGSSAILHALISRGEQGGSYGINVSLNYYSQWLVNSVGEYPAPIWQDLFARHNKPVFQNHHSMHYTLPVMLAMLDKYDKDVLFKDDFFERRTSKALGVEFRGVKPIAQFKDGVDLKYNVGTRGNGVDKAYWPEDLTVEVIA